MQDSLLFLREWVLDLGKWWSYVGTWKTHFNIAELFARKIRRGYDSLITNQETDLLKYHNVANFYIDELDKYNYKYDSEVYYNDERQINWNKKILLELEELDDYE